MAYDQALLKYNVLRLLNYIFTTDIKGLPNCMRHVPVIKGGSGSLVLCNTAVPDNTVINPQSSDAMLLAL